MTDLPNSKATTSYELLEEVERELLFEPLRFDYVAGVARQECMLDLVPGLSGEWPSCGTVACLAGWQVLLRHPHLRSQLQSFKVITALANRDLPPETHWDAHGLYNAVGIYEQELLRMSYETQQEYLDRALVSLRHFKTKWERELKAWKLDPPDVALGKAIEAGLER